MRNLTCSAKSLEPKMDALHFLLASVGLLFHILPTLCNAADSIRPPLFLSEGQTLVSEGGRFELGFFSPGDSRLRYVGIWYKTIPIRTVVWVANRENPIQDSRGLLMINSTRGSLQIHSGNHSLLWSSNSTKGIQNPVAQLLDSGNLVLRDEKEVPASVLWQSFDHPSDTLLPEMKLGWDSRTRFNRRLSSWKSSNDPSPGELTYGVELHSYPEGVMWKASNKFYRTGPWTSLWFSGLPELRPDPVYRFEFHMNKDEVYCTFQLKNKSEISRWVLNGTASPSGQRYIWVEAEKAWNLSHSLPRDSCDTYGLCGRNGICITTESHSCECLKGFEPKSRERWNEMDWSHGCVRSKALNCSNPNGFVKFDGLKLPDTTHTWVNTSMSLKECMVECLANCSCSAFANSDVRNGGSGCAIWFGDLIDIRQLPAGGQELHVRMPASGLGANNPAKRRTVVIVVAAAGIFCGMLFAYYCIRRNWNNLRGNDKGKYNNSEELEGDLELPLFDLATIVNATGNFSGNNKLGEGGFGPVYKGTLPDGQEIAVKKLSFSSEQGSNEFENEVTLIAKLQHRNLVKLLGCCIAREDKMLIYEYMPNKSLDFFIFDPEKANMLDWSKRFKIICGIARGLLYLHQDSRLRIIHRDLKASNVLLDNEMKPKISDFGLARSFENEHDTMANTNRVVGTYGYMAPEYAIDGLFSIKSDVFSFGILLLEIVSGKKNRVFFHRSHGLNLSGHVWKLWKEGRCLELVDASYEDSNSASEIVRCICIGLLCVQEQPEDRPDMASVILMLTSESLLVQPEQPGFFVDRDPSEHGESSSSRNQSRSASEMSASLLEAGYFLANVDNSRDKPHLVWPFFRKSLCGTATPCPRSHLDPI